MSALRVSFGEGRFGESRTELEALADLAGVDRPWLRGHLRELVLEKLAAADDARHGLTPTGGVLAPSDAPAAPEGI